jgi:hypothetical protein
MGRPKLPTKQLRNKRFVFQVSQEQLDEVNLPEGVRPGKFIDGIWRGIVAHNRSVREGAEQTSGSSLDGINLNDFLDGVLEELQAAKKTDISSTKPEIVKG